MTGVAIADIKHRLYEPGVLNLLSLSAYRPTPESMRGRADAYAADPAVHVYGCLNAGDSAETPRGAVVLKLIGDVSAEILSIAADPAYRGQGVGRALITCAAENLSGRALHAETDDEAVGFYRKCGFTIKNLGEKYPGIVRYHCILSQSTYR